MGGRKNTKEIMINNANSIKKSNQLSTAKLNEGLALNQMQLLAYAIYATQQDGSTTFIKADFEKKFGLDEYRTEHAKDDAQRILSIQVIFIFQAYLHSLPNLYWSRIGLGCFRLDLTHKESQHRCGRNISCPFQLWRYS